jgi:redox-sensitive bicupin YhaK (pirin superfamily)
VEHEARCVRDVVEPRPTLEGAGVHLRRTIGAHTLDYLDPFLLLDHFAADDPRDYLAGFPWHPHRGIETVTYMLAGEVDHHDSIGNAGTIGPGDVQWMTAGGGILHEEMPRPRDGRMAGFQLWVNLPASLKMTQPRYQEVGAGQIPLVRRDDGSVVRVVAGEVDGVGGPVTEIHAAPAYLDVTLPAGATFVQPVPRGHNAFAYVFEGEARFGVACEHGYRGDAGGELVPGPNLVVFADGDDVTIETEGEPARFLLVSGRPLDEPIARHGPFVMTTREQIRQALDDLQSDRFVWRDDPDWARPRTPRT